jgi:hypothetical protein
LMAPSLAGVTLANWRGMMETKAATHPVVREVDALQYELTEGPCIDAVRSGWPARSDDLRSDSRWPKYGPRAAELGVLSQMGMNCSTNPA